MPDINYCPYVSSHEDGVSQYSPLYEAQGIQPQQLYQSYVRQTVGLTPAYRQLYNGLHHVHEQPQQYQETFYNPRIQIGGWVPILFPCDDSYEPQDVSAFPQYSENPSNTQECANGGLFTSLEGWSILRRRRKEGSVAHDISCVRRSLDANLQAR